MKKLYLFVMVVLLLSNKQVLGQCAVLSSAEGSDVQVVCINVPITNITYVTMAIDTPGFDGLPAGVTGYWDPATFDVTISGTPTVRGVYNYTCTLACNTTVSGRIIVNDTPVIFVTPKLTCGASAASVTVSGHSADGPINIVNPDFEIIYKEGSTSVTAPLFQPGTGPNGLSDIGMTGPPVIFSDGSSGNRFDMAGWKWNTELAIGVENQNGNYSAGRDMIVWINGASFEGGTSEQTLSQVFSTDAEQLATYTITADFGWRFDNSAAPNPPVLRLYAGNTLLIPISSVSPAFVQGSFVTFSRKYFINNPGISGPLRIEIGKATSVTGQQLNIDHVTLTRKTTDYSYSWSTIPVQTDSAATGLSNASYNVIVTDYNGCSTSNFFDITPYNVPSVAGNDTVSICNGSSTNLNATGATGYSWFPAEGLNQATGASVIASPVHPVTYFVTAADPGACSDTVTINFKPLPVITSQSLATQTVCLNTLPAPLSVTVNGTGLSYQWYRTYNDTSYENATVIVGATGSVYVPSTLTDTTFYYYCIVTGDCSPAATSAISGAIIINVPPVIISQATDAQSVCLNEAATPLSVSASGAGITFQWYKNRDSSYRGATLISGATDPFYIPSTSAETTFYYYCIVNGTCYPHDTSAISGAITIKERPSVTLQSGSSQTRCLNDPINPLSVTASGAGITYQWYSNTINSYENATVLSGETNPYYRPDSSLTGTLYFYCVVSGSCSPPAKSAISGAITINAPTVITNQVLPAQTLCKNEPVIPLSVTASGTAPLTYQWYSNRTSSYENATSISGAIGSSYTPVSSLPGTLYFYCVVSGGCFSPVKSDISGAIIINAPPVITAQSTAAQTHCLNEPVTRLSVTATGTELTYQWYSNTTSSYNNATILSGDTNSSYRPDPGLPDTLYYFCIVSGTCASPDTSLISGAIIINAPPSIIDQSTPEQTVCLNIQATPLSITATGAQLTYQWYSNTSPENSGGLLLTDSTNSSIIPPTSAVGTLYYYCIVKGYCIEDSATSAVSGPVIVKPLPTASISGTTTVCQNSASPPVTFVGSNGTSPYTFFYNINGGPGQGVSSGAGDNTAFVYAPTNQLNVFTYYLTSVIDSYGCTQTQRGSDTITVITSPVFTSDKRLSVCDSAGFTYTASSSNTLTTFSWIRAAIPGQISNAVRNDTTRVISDTLNNITSLPVVVPYHFTLTTGSGCITADSLLVTVNPTPVINHIDSITYCNGEIDLDGIIFGSSSPDPSFTWSIDKSVGFGLHGSGNISGFIANNPGNDVLVATDTISVSVDNNLHCAGQPVSFKIIINPSATTPGFSWLDLNNGVLCSGASNINFNVNAPANANSYLWTTIPPYNPGVFIKDTNNANTVISFNDTGTYTIKVFATNQNGGCSDTVSKKIVVLNTSEIEKRKIFLKQPGNILIYPDNSMDSVNGYQWGYDSVITSAPDYSFGPSTAVAGQVYQFFIPAANKFFDNGILDTTTYKYWVLLRKGECYTKIYYNGPYASRPIATPTPEDNSVRLKVFPNPNNGLFNIELKGNIYGKIDAKIYNAVGQLVFVKQFLKTAPEVYESLDKNNLPNGLYYLVLSSSDMKKVSTRFVIQH